MERNATTRIGEPTSGDVGYDIDAAALTNGLRESHIRRLAPRDGESDPGRPIPAELEEVIEVTEPCRLEVVDDVAQARIVGDGTHDHEWPVDSELIGREIETLVDRLSCDASAFIRFAPDEEHGLTGRNVLGH